MVSDNRNQPRAKISAEPQIELCPQNLMDFDIELPSYHILDDRPQSSYLRAVAHEACQVILLSTLHFYTLRSRSCIYDFSLPADSTTTQSRIRQQEENATKEASQGREDPLGSTWQQLEEWNRMCCQGYMTKTDELRLDWRTSANLPSSKQ